MVAGLLEPRPGGNPARAGADDHDVEVAGGLEVGERHALNKRLMYHSVTQRAARWNNSARHLLTHGRKRVTLLGSMNAWVGKDASQRRYIPVHGG